MQGSTQGSDAKSRLYPLSFVRKGKLCSYRIPSFPSFSVFITNSLRTPGCPYCLLLLGQVGLLSWVTNCPKTRRLKTTISGGQEAASLGGPDSGAPTRLWSSCGLGPWFLTTQRGLPTAHVAVGRSLCSLPGGGGDGESHGLTTCSQKCCCSALLCWPPDLPWSSLSGAGDLRTWRWGHGATLEAVIAAVACLPICEFCFVLFFGHTTQLVGS